MQRGCTTHGAACPAGIPAWAGCAARHTAHPCRGCAVGPGMARPAVPWDPCWLLATEQMALSTVRPCCVQRIPVYSTAYGTSPCTRHRAHHIPTRGTSLPCGTSPCTVHPCATAYPYVWHVTAAMPMAVGRGCCCSGCFSNKNKGSARSPALAPSPGQGDAGAWPWRHRALQATGLRCPSAWGPVGVPEHSHGCGPQPRICGRDNPGCRRGTPTQPAQARQAPTADQGRRCGGVTSLAPCWGVVQAGLGTQGPPPAPGGGSERHHGGQQASHEPGPRCRELPNKHPLSGRWFV